MRVMSRILRLGLQQRIILYVAAGLAVMFGTFAFVGLWSIQRATDLVYQERLSTAYIIGGTLERDFLHVAREVQESSPGLLAPHGQLLTLATHKILEHLSETDPFPFFRVTGVWVFRDDGTLLAEAGKPRLGPGEDVAHLLSWPANVPGSQFVVLPDERESPGGVHFATIVIRLADPEGVGNRVVAVHAASLNSPAPYVPASYGTGGSREPSSLPQPDNRQGRYHLEVVSPLGFTILGIGEDERPGTKSRHFEVIRPFITEGRAVTLLHEPAWGDTFEPHVMAAVPVASSPFYVILEQPVDVALALPLQLRQMLVYLTTLGFLATLVVAWITTRNVVKPTEQLTAAAQRMAQGDLESPITVSAQDEVGKLAASLDTMRQKLRAAYQEIENANKELESQVKERTARLEEILAKVISAQEEERYRLARELHDETAQTLGALSISLDWARDNLQGVSPQAAEQITEAKAIANRLLEETRRLIFGLRPTVLDDLGLGPALRWYAESHLEEKGVATTVEIDPLPVRLPKHIEVSLFRVIQEALNNIAKHAQAKHVSLRLAFRDSVASVIIADDGTGFDVDRVLGPSAPVKSVGLLGMQERVRLLNGDIHIHSQEGKGTQITLEIPIAAEAA